MTAILGISAFYHDSAAALINDGRIIAAAQEERFTRIKHDSAFPARAIEFCLKEGGVSSDDLDYVAFYEKPLTKFERLLETYLAYAPRGFGSFRMAMPVWLKDKLHLRRTLRRGLKGPTDARLIFTDHHESHAASAFFPSPFEEAAIVTLDGVGEWSTTTYGVGEGNRIRLMDHISFPHSLGLLYSAFTYYCGFKVNSGEYKLMGLAPYGSPVYQDLILDRLIDLKADGSFWLDMSYFNYCQGLTMTNHRFHSLFGGPPRKPESPLEQRHMDLAASIQSVAEVVVLRIGRHVHARTGLKRLVLAGGVASIASPTVGCSEKVILRISGSNPLPVTLGRFGSCLVRLVPVVEQTPTGREPGCSARKLPWAQLHSRTDQCVLVWTRHLRAAIR